MFILSRSGKVCMMRRSMCISRCTLLLDRSPRRTEKRWDAGKVYGNRKSTERVESVYEFEVFKRIITVLAILQQLYRNILVSSSVLSKPAGDVWINVPFTLQLCSPLVFLLV